WVTIESEPAIFNQLLRSLGVHGLVTKEVFSLDDETLRSFAPIHGFVFLFRWKVEEKKEDGRQVSSQEQNQHDLWFANQTADNACATLALLNIVLNCPHLDVGPFLSTFKAATADLKAPLKGLALASSETLRQKHNAFAKRSEMAEADLHLMQRARRAATKRRKNEGEDAFHFIAYLPKDGHLWELDGLKPAPIQHSATLAPEEWYLNAVPMIQERIERYSAQEIRFSLLALAEDPAVSLTRKRQTLLALHDADPEKASLAEIDAQLAQIDAERKEEAMLAARRAHDYTPFVETMLTLLNEKGVLSSVFSSTP
ncbi:ubiquitin carboxyl-terminal hydrolase, partial [Protomyces lactucae-debilis]